MGLTAVVLVTSLMAMGPQWAIIDLPYPEVTGAGIDSPPIDPKIAEVVANYAKARPWGKGAKPQLSNYRLEKGTASLRLSMGDRVETVVLLRVNNEWRIIQSLVEGAEH